MSDRVTPGENNNMFDQQNDKRATNQDSEFARGSLMHSK